MSRPGFTLTALAAAVSLTLACTQTASTPTSPTPPGSGDTGGAATTLKVTAPTPISPVNDQRVADGPALSASAATRKFGGTEALQYRFEVYNAAGVKVVDSGLVSSPSFMVTTPLDFDTRHTWRVRAESDGAFGPWSTVASFRSPEGGYLRPGALFDPLTNGKTVGDRFGTTTFVAGQGIRLEENSSYVRYLIPPPSVTSGEFSMEVQGLQANAPGNKSKVFGMQEGQTDFITNPFRVDIQYRGTSGFPPNAITFRALYDGFGPYEPATDIRLASVFALNPSTTYFWKATWGSQFRLVVKEGGQNGRTLYDQAVPTPKGTYNPSPFYAYLGAPSGRSGVESASIPGVIYRNVYLGPGPRP